MPGGIAYSSSGNIYFVDGNNNQRIRKVTSGGIISTVAGNGIYGYSGDGGQATAAKINFPSDVVVDASGNLYIADYGNFRIRKVNTSGIISTFAGNGTRYNNGDGGQATAADLGIPQGLAIDASGNIYIATEGYIRKVNTSGIISTIGGNGTEGYTGDGGQATAAEINTDGLAIDLYGNLFINDVTNNVIRKINSAGIISTYAGNGTSGYSGDGGQATAAKFNQPSGIEVDISGNLYIADTWNERIRVVNHSTGIITSIAGNGTSNVTYSGDGGPAYSATGADPGIQPYTVCVDNQGNSFIGDGNCRIRKVTKLPCPANAGPNKIVENPGLCCAGIPVVIGTPAVPNMTYSWTPSTLLTPSTTTAQPTSTWSNTSQCQIYTVTVSYSLCTTSTSTVQVCAEGHIGAGCCRIAAGISKENEPSNSFVVYPNPASGQVTLSLSDKAEYIRIIDMQGRLVFETKDIAAGELKLDISKYNKGIYFVSSKMGNAVEKQKLIVE